MKKFSYSIIIPNWNGKSLLEKHLQKVVDVAGGAEVIVTDDASTDDSVRFIRTNYKSVVVVENHSQKGYAGNINVGVKHAHGDIVILLNSDVEPEKDFILPLVSHFEDPTVFAVGCLDKSYEKQRIVFRGRGIAAWNNGFYEHSKGEVTETDTAWVSGGSGAFRRSLWNELGGMDEIFNPFYWEDIDLSYRAIKKGFKIVFEPRSVVNHYHEIGVIKSDYSPVKVMEIVYRNQLIFCWKHMPNISELGKHVLRLGKDVVRALIHNQLHIVYGFFSAIIRIPHVIQYRLETR